MEEEGKQITCLIVCGCGGNRSLFETSSPTLSKKLCSFSPSRFSSSLLLDHLAAIFSDMDTHFRFLSEQSTNVGDDFDSAIRSLNQLRLKFTDQKPELSLVQEEANVGNEECFRHESRWTASRALEALEKSIKARVCADAAMQSSVQHENLMLRLQLGAIVQENSLLKRAVVTLGCQMGGLSMGRTAENSGGEQVCSHASSETSTAEQQFHP
ncbi:hypothetical protein HID58_087207 [Brassica napus]|uniref:Uncharacterized protein n=1 Tax=Brassica napus TaxID=3708 RepID=A0ABQ7XSP8_BRANA|nr:hypothetical protein HID58_087207 [Brassica napus]